MPYKQKIDLERLVNNLKVGVFRSALDFKGRFLFVNDTLNFMLGYNAKELLNAKVVQIFENNRNYSAFNRRTKSQGYISYEEVSLKKKDGKLIPCFIAVTVVKDSKGKVKWIDGVVEDISAHKCVEKELLESKELFRVVFDNSAVAITVTDKDEKIIAWNPFAEKMLGMDKTDLFNKPVRNLYPQKEWKKIRERGIRKKGVQPIMETRVVRSDGKLIDVDLSISVLKDLNGKVTGAIGIMRDITKRKTAEKKLKDSEGKIRVILDNSAFAVTLLNKNERIISWNRFTEQLFGMKRKDLYLKPVSILYPREEWAKIRAARIRQIGSKHNFETKVVKKDKTVMDVDLSVEVLKDSEDNIIGSVGIIQDITERKKVQRELIKAKIAAEEANYSKSLFLANVSHEVRTPMNAILGMVDMTLDTDLTQEQKDNLIIVKDAADNLLDLINDILDLSRIEAGKINLEVIEFNLRDVIKNMCRGLHVLARNKNLELLWSVDSNVPDILKGDPVRLRQVIINLVNNAIKFTSKGKVEIDVKMQASLNNKCKLILSVSDTGIGIPQDKQKLIFDAFAQADDSITRRYGGTRLGLAISKRLVNMMGGHIWIESEEGKGSKFSFIAFFDLAKKGILEEKKIESKEEIKIKPQIDEDIGVLNVLLAEDNLVNQKIITKLLGKRGWKVSVAQNGQEVLGLINKEPFDLVLMDVQMPVLDGLETTKLIREGEKQTGKHIPIIAMTARAMEEDKKGCLKSGMDGYISKPIDRIKLFSIIKDIAKKG